MLANQVPIPKAPDRIQTMRILIVEDVPLARLMLRRTLDRDLRCQDVEEAENGSVALQMLADKEFQLVILDLKLSVMDGVDVLRAIRSSPALASMPVAVLTDERDAAKVREVVSLGVSAYMVKPLTRETAMAHLGPLVHSEMVPAQGLTRMSALRTSAIFAAKRLGEVVSTEVALTPLGTGSASGEGVLVTLPFVWPDGETRLQLAFSCNHVSGCGLATGLLGTEFLAATEGEMLEGASRACQMLAERILQGLSSEGITAELGAVAAGTVTLQPWSGEEDDLVLNFQSDSANFAFRVELRTWPASAVPDEEASLSLPDLPPRL